MPSNNKKMTSIIITDGKSADTSNPSSTHTRRSDMAVLIVLFFSQSPKGLANVGPALSHTLDCLLFQYMLTHGTKRAEINFLVFLTIFEYAESDAEWCQAQLFMQRLEFHDLKLGLENRSKIFQKQRFQPVQGICTCMPALYVTHGMRRAKIIFTMFLTFFEYAESNAERC